MAKAPVTHGIMPWKWPLAFLLLAPVATPAQAQTFAAFGDYGNGPGANAVATLVKGRNPDAIITVGDNCYGSTALANQIGNKYGSYITAGKFWPSLGNHEYSDGCGGAGASKYKAYFTLPNNERYYDKLIGSVHFFIVNSNGMKDPDGASATSKQAQWIKARVLASTAPWKAVVFHHPAYSSGDHGSKTSMRWPFEAWGIDLVLNGHDHNYERVMQDANGDGVKLPYIVTGLGGQSPRAFKTPIAGSVVRYKDGYGALFITASATSLGMEFRNTSGTVIDTYSMTKGAAAKSTAFDFRTVPGE